MPVQPSPTPTPAPAPIAQQAPSAPAAHGGMSMSVAVAAIIIVLLAAAGAYAYWMLGMPQAAAPLDDNTLVVEQNPTQDDLSGLEAEINSESQSNFDAEMDGLENSF